MIRPPKQYVRCVFWFTICTSIIILFVTYSKVRLPSTQSYNEISTTPNVIRSTEHTNKSRYTFQDLVQITNLLESPTLNYKEKQLKTNNTSKNSIHLITEWYHEVDIRRRYELVAVLRMNTINDAVSNIHFVQRSLQCTVLDDVKIDTEFPYELLKSKLVISYLRSLNRTERLTFSEALTYANEAIPKNDYSVMLNLDIFFDRTLGFLKHMPIHDHQQAFYLSRYEIDPSICSIRHQCSEQYVGSHDVLIFRPPIPPKVIHELPYEFGTWNAEVKIIYELIKANYTVRNVCKSIRVWHFHSSQVRHRNMPTDKYVPDSLLHLVMRPPVYL